MLPIDRRRFVETSTLVAGGLLLTPADALLAASTTPDIVDVSGADPAKMAAVAVQALGGMGRFVKKGAKVVIKPNIGFAKPPAWATTTEPRVVVAVARMCLEAGASSVLVVEHPVQDAEKCARRSGMRGALAGLNGVKLKMLGDSGDFVETAVPGGDELDETDLAVDVKNADVLINIPVAKQHSGTGVSFGLKNAMGIIKSRRWFHVTKNLHEAVADLGRLVRPQLTILDATRSLLNGGPWGPGDVIQSNRIIAGTNVVSTDAYGLTVAPFDGKKMTLNDAPHIRLAGDIGLGETDIRKLRIEKRRT